MPAEKWIGAISWHTKCGASTHIGVDEQICENSFNLSIVFAMNL